METLPNLPSDELSGAKFSKSLKQSSGFLIFVSVSLIFLLSLGTILVLNYYGVLRLVDLHSALSVLSTKESQGAMPEITIPCPTTDEFCKDFAPILKNDKYTGAAANVKEGSPVYAVFDGRAVTRSVQGPDTGRFYQVRLENKDGTLVAFYFTGEPVDVSGEFKKGATIMKVSGGQIKYYNNYNFAFLLEKEGGEAVSYENITFR